MTERIAVVGAGSWGTTLAKILAENGAPVSLWARQKSFCDEINSQHQNARYLPGASLPESVVATDDLRRTCESSSLIVLAVPSHGVRTVAREMGNYLHGEHVLIHAIKGIEQDTFKRVSEVLREETCVRKIGVLSGPNLAKELAQRKPAGTLIASAFDEVYRRGHAALNNNYFRVYGNRDVVGAEVGGAFKNIVALAAGVVDGLALGDNTKALLLTRGIGEMSRFGIAMGAQMLTFAGMAGMGDLIATCSSPFSRNHQVGTRIAKGETLAHIQSTMHMVAEGVRTTRAVQQYAEENGLFLPIVRTMDRLLYAGISVKEALDELMAIPTGAEFGDKSL